jgi:hypothetical protein
LLRINERLPVPGRRFLPNSARPGGVWPFAIMVSVYQRGLMPFGNINWVRSRKNLDIRLFPQRGRRVGRSVGGEFFPSGAGVLFDPSLRIFAAMRFAVIERAVGTFRMKV